MDQDNELARFKWLLFAGIMFLISGYYSISELRFAVSGKTIEASLTQVKQTMSTGRRSRPRLSFEYQFAEADGKTRSERDVVSVDWPAPTAGTVTIQYIPGVANASRLLGHSNMVWVYVFMGCSVAMAVSIYLLCRAANEPIRRGSSPRKKN